MGVNTLSPDISNLENSSHLILFDGVCNLCNASVNFVIDRDKHKKFRFLALQSEAGKKIMEEHKASTSSLESIVLIKQGKLFRKSTAILYIARDLIGPWPLFYFFIIVPTFLRDLVYDFVAQHRYSWFGKSDQCRVPTPELRERFVEDI